MVCKYTFWWWFGTCLITLHSLNSLSHFHLPLLFISKPVTSAYPTLSVAFILSHLPFPPPLTFPIFPINVSHCFISSCLFLHPLLLLLRLFFLAHPLFCLHFFPPAAPYWRGETSSLSSLFASELILTPGYSPADERWGSVDILYMQPTIPLLRVAVWEKTYPPKKRSELMIKQAHWQIQQHTHSHILNIFTDINAGLHSHPQHFLTHHFTVVLCLSYCLICTFYHSWMLLKCERINHLTLPSGGETPEWLPLGTQKYHAGYIYNIL